MKHKCLIFLILVFCLLIYPPLNSFAAPKASKKLNFTQCKSQYQSLLDSDPNIEDLQTWEKLTANIQNVEEKKNKLEVYNLLSRIYDTIYVKRKFQPALSKAVYYYELIGSEFSGKEEAASALLRLGDLKKNELQDEVGARAAYFEIIDVYPSSPQAVEAKNRLGVKEEQLVEKTTKDNDAKEKPKIPEEALPDFKNQNSIEVISEPTNTLRPTIVIDPGHGGEEKGAIGVNEILEKEVVLNISKYLDELLRERLRAKTVLTRTTDVTLPLADRTKIANDNKADLFISVHANASEYKTLKGIETYYLDNTNDKSSLKLAKRENATIGKETNDLGFIISDFIQSAKLDDSISLSHHIQNALVSNFSLYYKTTKDLGVKKAPFYVLVGAHMPCVLVEVSFIDNPEEGKLLITERYQRLAALGIYKGIRNYFQSHAK